MSSPAPPIAHIHRLVWTGLLAALIAVGSFIAIPLGPLSPVPVTLQTFFVLLAGLVLGPRGGILCVLLYLAAGCLGLPVFAGGKAGLAVLLGPTGGFLYGFVLAAGMCGIAGGESPQPFITVFVMCALGTLATLMCGVLQFMVVLNISLTKALVVGVVPFLPGMLIKCLAAALAYRFLASRRLLPL